MDLCVTQKRAKGKTEQQAEPAQDTQARKQSTSGAQAHKQAHKQAHHSTWMCVLHH
jgi:hypothetical protein